MILEILIAITFGCMMGIVTGITPGLHINLVAIILLSFSPFLLSHTNVIVVAAFIDCINAFWTMSVWIGTLIIGFFKLICDLIWPHCLIFAKNLPLNNHRTCLIMQLIQLLIWMVQLINFLKGQNKSNNENILKTHIFICILELIKNYINTLIIPIRNIINL